MKRILFFQRLILINGFFFSLLPGSYSQTTVVTTYVGMSKLYTACQGQIYLIQCYGHANPGDVYYKKISSCTLDLDREVNNNSLKWEGAGIEIIEQGFNRDRQPYLLAKINETGKIKVSWSEKFIYPATDCDPGYIIDRVYVGITEKETFYIPKPPTPILKASPSQVAEINQDIIVSAEGCPNSTSDLPVSYQFAHASSCSEHNIQYEVDNYFTSEKTRRVYSLTPTKKYVKVRCKVGDCEGEFSDPISIRILEKPNASPPNCNLGEVDEAGYFQNREDFHRYSLAKEICDKSIDQDCTVENVFKILISQQKNSIPQLKDFPPSIFTFPTAPIVASGLENLYYYSSIPSSNCQQTGVYSPFSSYFLIKAPLPCLTISNSGYFWDPITQFIDNSSHTITNFTLPGHILHPGKVMISIKEDDCKVLGQVIGMGNSALFDCIEKAGIYLSKKLNVDTGLYAFDKLLGRLKQLYDSKTWK